VAYKYSSAKGHQQMLKRYGIILAVIFAITLITTSCSNNQQLRPPGSTSVGGARIETALEANDNLVITESQTTFEKNQQFYFYFNNNRSFQSEQLTVQLIDNRNERILAESDYEVNPDQYELTDKIWFGSEGMFTIVVKVDGEVRATREVIIE